MLCMEMQKIYIKHIFLAGPKKKKKNEAHPPFILASFVWVYVMDNVIR